MISDICKRRGCDYLAHDDHGDYCVKLGYHLNYDEDEQQPCEDEMYHLSDIEGD